MLESVHYTHIIGKDILSKGKLQQIRNYVNTAKEFLRTGKSSFGRSFHCCFVFDHSKLRIIGFNSYKYKIDFIPHLGKIKKFTDKNYQMCKHAEVDAVLKLGNINFSNLTFVNVHIDKNFHCKNSKPCMNCFSLMQQVGVKDCIYFDEKTNKWLKLKV